jgi:dephospho-CoA kinase
MRVFGLTGGIGCGKSAVAGLLREAGIPVVDADAIAREAASPGTPCHAEIVAEFGEGILFPDGSIDRGKLGGIVFSDPSLRARLEAITIPRIREGIEESLSRLEAEGHAAAFVEAALLLENRRESRFEAVVCVHCAPEEQLRRIVSRGGLSESEARRRIAAQMPAEEKARRSDHVVDNSGAISETAARVDALLSRLGIAGDRRG